VGLRSLLLGAQDDPRPFDLNDIEHEPTDEQLAVLMPSPKRPDAAAIWPVAT
jgi:hypothetical protein